MGVFTIILIGSIIGSVGLIFLSVVLKEELDTAPPGEKKSKKHLLYTVVDDILMACGGTFAILAITSICLLTPIQRWITKDFLAEAVGVMQKEPGLARATVNQVILPSLIYSDFNQWLEYIDKTSNTLVLVDSATWFMKNVTDEIQNLKYTIERSPSEEDRTIDLSYKVIDPKTGRVIDSIPKAGVNIDQLISKWRDLHEKGGSEINGTNIDTLSLSIKPNDSLKISQCAIKFLPTDYKYPLNLQRPCGNYLTFVARFPESYKVGFQFLRPRSDDTTLCDSITVYDPTARKLNHKARAKALLPYQGIICEWRPK